MKVHHISHKFDVAEVLNCILSIFIDNKIQSIYSSSGLISSELVPF